MYKIKSLIIKVELKSFKYLLQKLIVPCVTNYDICEEEYVDFLESYKIFADNNK
jgi:hypothetical protein